MSVLQEQAAIRNRVFIGGKIFLRDPNRVEISTTRFESGKRLSNGSMRRDRMYTGPGMPNVRNRCEFNLPWSDLREPDLLEHLGLLQAIGQPFGLGLWKQTYDVFDGDGERTTFYLQRRQLLPAVSPSTAFPDYPTRVLRLDASYPDGASTDLAVVQKSSATINTGTPAAGEAWVENEGHMNGFLWVTTMRLGTPPIASADSLIAIYIPMYEVMIDSEPPRAHTERLREQRALKLVEFG